MLYLHLILHRENRKNCCRGVNNDQRRGRILYCRRIKPPQIRFRQREKRTKMVNHIVSELGHKKYIEITPGSQPLESDQDAADIIGVCMEHGSQRILIHTGVFPAGFYKLRTGIAGIFQQKFVNYGVTAAIIADPADIKGSTFTDMMTEANKGGHFRFFTDRAAAVAWLMQDANG